MHVRPAHARSVQRAWTQAGGAPVGSAAVRSRVLPCACAAALQDLEKLISKAVDPAKADYAVVTGTQIHNWAVSLDDPASYSMEFVAPTSVYAVVNGVATHLDLSQIPQVTPRMLNLLATSSMGGVPVGDLDASMSSTSGASSTLQQIPSSYLFSRLVSRPKASFLTAGNGPRN